MSTKTETRGAILFFEDNKYLHITFKNKISIDLELAKEIGEATQKLVGDIPHGNIVDTRKSSFITSDARKYFADQEKGSLVGVALYINSRIQSGLANLYFKFTKRSVENKIFTDESAAKAWIDSKLK